jgi:hypothetical protein
MLAEYMAQLEAEQNGESEAGGAADQIVSEQPVR